MEDFQEQKEDFVKMVSDENRGVGSDGVIFLESAENHEGMDFLWEYYNKDGSNVEMCGNGARAVAKYYYNNIEKQDKLYYRNNFGIETNAIIDGSRVRVTMPEIENLGIELGDKIMNELKVDDIKFLGGYNVEEVIKKYPTLVSGIRGRGLMLGIESKIKNEILIKEMINHKLLTVKASQNIIRILPPLILEEKHVDEAILKINKAFKNL